MLMKKIFIVCALWLVNAAASAQSLPGAMKLPDFVQPTPEVSALLKADNLSVNYATGSPNISIPIGSLSVNGINLPITLSYNSTGVKVDEYSSMVGNGWTCSSGGVVSRTIFDKPDEVRESSSDPTNMSNPDFTSQNAALLNFLENTPDAESDIFSFSFLNYSGKFIIDSLRTGVIPMSNYNVKISLINNDFRNGFQMITEDGAIYRFEDAEISKNRSPQGSNCPRNYESYDRKTSWYLTKITSPNKRSYINFTYTTQDITYEQSISQYISKVTSSNYYQTGGYAPCDGGIAANVGTETFYTCIPRQLVTSKFISTISTSANDTVTFTYDASARQDLDAGKRLSQIKIKNRNGAVIKQVTLYGSYSNGIGSSSYSSYTKRLYLDSMTVDDIYVSANTLSYKFEYLSRNSVSARLTFMQDLYGYSNSQGANPSLIPILPSTDMNYSHFNNGQNGSSVNFGNRSVDTNYARYGLLNKIIYPTGGYDTILYQPNKYYSGGTEKLAGGSSVVSIRSYSFGLKMLEKSFSYLDTSGHSSSFMITELTSFSTQATLKKDGYICACQYCYDVPYCVGPSYVIANISSNLVTPLADLGGQHVYHRNVTEKTVGNTNNGYTEHYYEFFNGGNLVPVDVLNNPVLSAPRRIVSQFVVGEAQTQIYRYDTSTSSYKLQKRIKKYINTNHNYTNYYNYVIKKNFSPILHGSPTPWQCEFEPFDVTKYPITMYDTYTDSTKEITYDNNYDSFIVKTITEHANSLHSYPTKQKVFTPEGDTLETRNSYPLDGSASVLTARHIVAPVLEEKKYKNSTLLSTVTNSYYDWFSDSTVVALQQTEYKELTNSMPAHVKYINYDTLGNVLEIAKDSGAHKSYMWGYKKQLPIAVATNAAANEIFYTSFEETDGTTDSDAKTGGKSRSSNYTVSFSLPNGKSYILTYWSWDGSKWVYNETSYTGSTTITVSNKIDEIRVYPADAQMVTFTYEPMLGMTSQCDARNQVSYYEYDALNRLKLIRDQDRKIIKLFDYKYQQ